jgi:hypothetical protein
VTRGPARPTAPRAHRECIGAVRSWADEKTQSVSVVRLQLEHAKAPSAGQAGADLAEACKLLRRAADVISAYEIGTESETRVLPDIGAFLARVDPR